jgi:hypothetical protein
MVRANGRRVNVVSAGMSVMQGTRLAQHAAGQPGGQSQGEGHCGESEAGRSDGTFESGCAHPEQHPPAVSTDDIEPAWLHCDPWQGNAPAGRINITAASNDRPREIVLSMRQTFIENTSAQEDSI